MACGSSLPLLTNLPYCSCYYLYGMGMAWHGMGHWTMGGIGHGMRRPGLAWPGGSLTLADSFTRTQREKWDGLH